MKWFCKYWVLKKQYDALLKKYQELYDMVDQNFWKKEDLYDRYSIDVFKPVS